jgi:1-acyl-sn-glycerol-3-phosphate acyltransferase
MWRSRERGMIEQTTLKERPLGRNALIGAITGFLAGHDPTRLDESRVALEREIDAAGPAALATLNQRLATAGADWTYYRGDVLARTIHRVVAERLMPADSALLGVEHLEAVAGAPVVVCANHLSYSDANVLDVLLHRAGADAFADRLTVIAGPKVYSSTRRRFSSLCFGTIKTPQSSALSTEDAVMQAREVARAARQCITTAHERLRLCDALLVFVEGSRSRTGQMQQALAAVARYFEVPGTWILPVGITGSELMFPVGEDDRLYPVTLTARVGPPFRAERLRALTGSNRRLAMDVVGLAIAGTLPARYQGLYADGAGDLDDARSVLATLRS